MRHSPTVGGTLMLALLVSACSSSSDSLGNRSPEPPSGIAGANSDTSTADTGHGCPQLIADVPEDLDTRRTHTARGTGVPASIGVIWSNEDSTRVVNVSSAASDQPFGDGHDIEPREREVQGTTASEIVNGDVRRIAWQQAGATAPCTYWTVVVQGLSQDELEVVLESVEERT
jgi:hypothetical protein